MYGFSTRRRISFSEYGSRANKYRPTELTINVTAIAVIANVAYCAAYIVDLFVQSSGFRELWQQYRWLLFAIGTIFAAIITRFVAMGMFQHGVASY